MVSGQITEMCLQVAVIYLIIKLHLIFSLLKQWDKLNNFFFSWEGVGGGGGGELRGEGSLKHINR